MPPVAAHAAPPPVDGQSEDMALLRRYVELGSQDAFTQLVSRHLPWVYSTCRKALRDPHTAEDAAQAVFIILSRRASTITPQTRLSGWLFNTARFVVKDAYKQESRYRRRENAARDMAQERLLPQRAPVDASTQAALDDALATLTERDRLALLMHFYEGLSLAEMADILGISKEGAKKRVARALGRLRGRLGNKRSTLALAAVAMLLHGHKASAFPAGLGQVVVTAAIVPGRATAVAHWFAEQAMNAAAGASRRLLRAALAAELTVAVIAVSMMTFPASKRPAPPAQASAAQRAAATPAAHRAPAPIRWSSKPRVGGAPAGNPQVVSTETEPPYRSGADDPDPQESPPTPATTPKKLVQAAPPVVEAAPQVQTPVGGSTFAGLPPVTRVAPAQDPLPQATARAAADPAATQLSTAAARAIAMNVSTATGSATARSEQPTGSVQRGVTGMPDVTPSAVPVPTPTTPPGTPPPPWKDGIGDPADPSNTVTGRDCHHWQDAGGDYAHGDAGHDPERFARYVARVQRMFVESGDNDGFRAFLDRHPGWSNHPFAVVAGEGTDDHHTSTGGHSFPTQWVGHTGPWGCPDSDFVSHSHHPAFDSGLAGPAPVDYSLVPEPSLAGIALLLSGPVLLRRRGRR